MPKDDTMLEKLWKVGFRITRTLKGFPCPRTIASDRVSSAKYFYEGRLRKTSLCLFQYTLRGYGVFWDARGEYRLAPGTGFLCEVSDVRTGYCYPQSCSQPWVHLFCSFHGAEAMVRELVVRFGPVYRLDLDSPLVTRLRNYSRYNGSTLEMTPGEGASLVTGLLGALADIGTRNTMQTPGARLIREARRIVGMHVEDAFNASDLAAELRVSLAHLCRTFRQEFGTTPLQFITQVKIRHAAELLRESNLSCKEIAARMSYDNSSHFARVFRRHMGITPNRFRCQMAIPV